MQDAVNHEQKIFARRLAVLGAFFGVCLLAFTALLYNAQIIHGDEYLTQSVHNITSTETVEASRGILTDRNGRILVSNRLGYTLTFDSSAFSGDTQAMNAAIFRLVELCRREDVAWTDTLPLSKTAPFFYTFSGEASQVSRLSRFIVAQKWSDEPLNIDAPSPDLFPSELFSMMRELFEIDPSYSDTDARAIMGVRYELAIRKLINTTAYIFAEDVSTRILSLITDGDYTGVEIGSSSVREYQTPYAAHILGYIGRISDVDYPTLREQGYALDDLVGRGGAEAAFEQYLRGKDGTRIISTNSEGRVTSELYSIEPDPGSTVALTIDIDFQAAVEDILRETVQTMTAADDVSRGAAAAVVEVGTGEVLALASYPTYDLATFRQTNENYNALLNDPLDPMWNRATQAVYAPGSTFKMVTAVSAIESGIISPKTKIRTLGQYKFYRDYQPRCWIFTDYGGTHGTIDVSEAIKVSCNYFFYEVGRLTGISTIAQYAAAFGLGEPTGIEIPERLGVMTTPAYFDTLENEYWTDGQTLSASIGQSKSSFTPLQLANYVATLVGGGTRYNAHLLKNVRAYDNSSLIYTYDEPPAQSLYLSDETVAAIKKGMGDLVTSGSIAASFRDCIVTAGAKTGTAQTGTDKADGIFVCFAPFDDPQIAVALVIEKGEAGGALASSGAAILNAYFSADGNFTVTGEDTLLP